MLRILPIILGSRIQLLQKQVTKFYVKVSEIVTRKANKNKINDT